MRFYGRTNITPLYVAICSNCLCGIDTIGVHDSFSEWKIVKVIGVMFLVHGRNTQDISLCGLWRTVLSHISVWSLRRMGLVFKIFTISRKVWKYRGWPTGSSEIWSAIIPIWMWRSRNGSLDSIWKNRNVEVYKTTNSVVLRTISCVIGITIVPASQSLWMKWWRVRMATFLM